jgi:hypothetical protein
MKGFMYTSPVLHGLHKLNYIFSNQFEIVLFYSTVKIESTRCLAEDLQTNLEHLLFDFLLVIYYWFCESTLFCKQKCYLLDLVVKT